MKTTHCEDCGYALRTSRQSIHVAPGTRVRAGNKCKPCHKKNQATGEPVHEIIKCTGCDKTTRHPQENPLNAPGTVVRYENGKCAVCRRKVEIPESEVRYIRSGLDSWLDSRRKRLGAA